MRKLLLCLVLMALFFLSGCQSAPLPLLPHEHMIDMPAESLPEAIAPPALTSHSVATLYFRYQDEPYLAPETRAIVASPDQPYEMSLITALLAGPGTRSTSLSALFPSGTHVRSTSLVGRTLFVTLTSQIMNGYPDERGIHLQEGKWAEEAPLRRRLCMQSLVATVTENCEVDEVQVLVEQPGSIKETTRLKQSYFLLGDTESLTGVMTRDDTLLLTPQTAMDVMLSLWQQHDWLRLYRYLVRVDPKTHVERMTYDDFVTTMENLPQLAHAVVSSGAISPDGQQATFTLRAMLLYEDGHVVEQEGRIVRLVREDGLWRFSLRGLTSWLEDRS